MGINSLDVEFQFSYSSFSSGNARVEQRTSDIFELGVAAIPATTVMIAGLLIPN
jgi:hypothetical protein